MNILDKLKGPSFAHPLGTDRFGRDLLTRILYGMRTTLRISASSVFLSAFVGSFIGIFAAYLGGAADTLIMRGMDIMFAIPILLLAIAIAAIVRSGTLGAILAIGIVYVPIFARISRGPTLSVKEQSYIEAARAGGRGSLTIIGRHVVPNVAAPIFVQITINLATAIIVESSLSFLGLGPTPPTPSLGVMISTGRNYLRLSPWPILVPGLAISTIILGFNLLGDALRETIDPKFRGTHAN
jgi:peptide/nickel transport system permease protein